MIDLDAIKARDAGSAATWFEGPASFTAQAARDRRELLALLVEHDAPLNTKPAPERTPCAMKRGKGGPLVWDWKCECGFFVTTDERPRCPRDRPLTGTGLAWERGGDALAWAIRFHETYESLAPSFGYETRTDTRRFDPESKNGRLMVAVIAELMDGQE